MRLIGVGNNIVEADAKDKMSVILTDADGRKSVNRDRHD